MITSSQIETLIAVDMRSLADSLNAEQGLVEPTNETRATCYGRQARVWEVSA